MSRRQWQRVPGSRDREWHIFAGMNAMTCHVVLGKGSQDPYEIQTGRSFWTLFHLTDSNHVQVRSQSLVCSIIKHVRSVLLAVVPAAGAVPKGFHQMAMNFLSWRLLHVQKSYHSTSLLFGPLLPVDSMYLTHGCSAQCCHLAWLCQLTNTGSSSATPIAVTSLLWTSHAL